MTVKEASLSGEDRVELPGPTLLVFEGEDSVAAFGDVENEGEKENGGTPAVVEDTHPQCRPAIG